MEEKLRVEQYTPGERALKTMARIKMVLLVGITGAGKDTVKKQLLCSDEYSRMITTVTRLPRENNGILEQHGREYYFTSKDEALQAVDNGEYAEVAWVHGQIYGARVDELERIDTAGKIALADVDYQGADYYQEHSNAYIVCLMPPSYQQWIERARSRYPDEATFQQEWVERSASARRELTWMLSDDDILFAVNDDIDRVAEVISDICKGTVDADEQERGRAIARSILDTLS